jgi:hypothetical protein
VGSGRRALGLQGLAGVWRRRRAWSWPCGGHRHAAARPPTTATQAQIVRCNPIQHGHHRPRIQCHHDDRSHPTRGRCLFT